LGLPSLGTYRSFAPSVTILQVLDDPSTQSVLGVAVTSQTGRAKVLRLITVFPKAVATFIDDTDFILTIP
jgi:hypothetical protein